MLYLVKDQLKDNDFTLFLRETTIDFSNPFILFEAGHSDGSSKVTSKLIMKYFIRRFGKGEHIRFWFFNFPESIVEEGKIKNDNFSVAYVTNELHARVDNLNAAHYFVDGYHEPRVLDYLPKKYELYNKEEGDLYIDDAPDYYDQKKISRYLIGDKESELLSSRIAQR